MTINEICKEIKKLNNIAIFSHNRPDGDTIGSAIALQLALTKLNKKVTLVCDNKIPEKFCFINNANNYILSSELNGNFDGYISVDCASDSVFLEGYSVFIKHNVTINIDHHISNTRYAKFNYVEDKGACCEIMYKVINELGVQIDNEIANCLLLGIITDTGNFGHDNVTDETLLITSNLLKCGGSIHYIVKKMFREQPIERAKLYAKVISNLRFYLDGKMAVIITTLNDLETFNADQSMTEGFIDFPLSIKGVEVAISLLETGKNRYKISFRSSGNVNVNEIASIYGGGGHILASGCMINGTLEEIIDKLEFNVKQRV